MLTLPMLISPAKINTTFLHDGNFINIIICTGNGLVRTVLKLIYHFYTLIQSNTRESGNVISICNGNVLHIQLAAYAYLKKCESLHFDYKYLNRPVRAFQVPPGQHDYD